MALYDPDYHTEHRTDLPPAAVTWLLLIGMALGYMLQDANGRAFELRFALWPVGRDVMALSAGGWLEFGFAPWQLLSYAFLHADLWHLVFNGLAILAFGRRVEAVVGVLRYTLFVLVTLIGSGIAQLITLELTLPAGESAPTIGASGMVYAVLFAYGYLFPRRILFPLLPLPAWLLVAVCGGIELWLGLTQPQSSVAHFVHLGGMLFAWLLLRRWWRQGRIRRRQARYPAASDQRQSPM